MYKFIEVGKLLKPYRTEGFLVAVHNQIFSEELLSCEAIFIKVNGLQVPFFVEEIEIEEDLSYIKFEEFKNPDNIKKFNGSSLYIRKRDLITKKGYESKMRLQDDFVGYIIFDKNTNNQLTIIDIEKYPRQLIANVVFLDSKKKEEKTLKIPLVEELVVSIDDNSKVISMDLPDGLLDL